MKNLKKDSKGFAPLAILLLVVVVAALGYAGWMVYQNGQDKTPTTANTSTQQTSKKVTISDSKGVDKSEKEMDSADVQSDLDTADLDADLNAVL